MRAFRAARKAVIFVSHSLSGVELMCDRALGLDRGRVRGLGDTSEVVRAYLDATEDADEAAGGAALSVDRVDVLDRFGHATEQLDAQEPFTVELDGTAFHELIEPVFVVTI